MAIDFKAPNVEISGNLIFAFESLSDLQRLLDVLDAGVLEKPLFNEDIAEFADELRKTIEAYSI